MTVYRAFSSTSYWNTPLPATVPIDPASTTFVGALKKLGTHVFLKPNIPVYFAKDGDPSLKVAGANATVQKLPTLRIPAEAQGSSNSDSVITIYDLGRGWVIQLWKFDGHSAQGASLYYLASNGLAGTLAESDDRRNYGHRGIPASQQAIRLEEVKAGLIPHVVEMFVGSTASRHVFPMTGDEGHGGAIPEGARTEELRAMKVEPKYVKVRDGLYDVMKAEGVPIDELDLTGFMWGWAANAARHILGLDAQPNPAIVTIG